MPQMPMMPVGAPPMPKNPPPPVPTRPPMPSVASLHAVIRKHEAERRQAETAQTAPAGHPPFHPGIPALRKMTDSELNAMKEKQMKMAQSMKMLQSLEQQKIVTSTPTKVAFLTKCLSGKPQPINGF